MKIGSQNEVIMVKPKDSEKIEVVQSLEELNLEKGIEVSISLINRFIMTPSKKVNLLRDVKNVKNKNVLLRIMWAIVLSGDGLAIKDSYWQKKHNA